MNPIKMSLICTIQILEKAIYLSSKNEFRKLEKMEYEALEKYRDELIPIYNEITKGKNNADNSESD
jgi:hypothetical protein